MSKVITLNRLSDFLTNLKGLFVTKTDAESTYATKEELNSAKTTADDTYETKTDAATHLTKIDAETTYATKTELTTAENNASNTYLSKTDAKATYATKAENNTKANDSEVVHKSGDETIADTKTFSKSIVGSVTGSSGSCTGNAATATKLATARTISLTGAVTGSTSFNGSANASINTTLSNIDASKITSGTIDLARIPKAAIPELKIVADDTARFALTTSDIQNGDTVQVTSTGKMYYVKDQTKLSSEAGYAVYTAGAASSVPWSGVTDKPSTFTPSSHTHDDRYYTETEVNNLLDGKANTSGTYSNLTVGNAGSATNATYANWLRTSSHSDHLFHTEWDGAGYFWTYVTAGDGGHRAVRVARSDSATTAEACTGNSATATRANSAASADTATNATNATNSNAANQLQAFVNDDFTGGNHYVKAIRSSLGWSTHLWMCYNNGAKMADEVSVNYANSAGSANTANLATTAATAQACTGNAATATNATYANWLRTSSHSDHLFHTEWDGGYFWTYVTAGDGGYRAVRVARSDSSSNADIATKATQDAAGNTITTTYLSKTDAANTYATKEELAKEIAKVKLMIRGSGILS